MRDSNKFGKARRMADIADRIRELRASLKMTQEEFAAMAGVTRGAVGNWEKGGGVSKDNLEVIAERTGVALEWLMTGRGEAGHVRAQAPAQGPVAANPREHEWLKHAYAAFLEALSDEATGIRWLELVEELEEVSRPPEGSPESPIDHQRIRTQAETLAALAKRRMRISKAKKS